MASLVPTPVPDQAQAPGLNLFGKVQFACLLVWTAFSISVAMLVRWVTGSARRPLRMASTLWSRGILLGGRAKLQVHGAESIDWSRPYLVVSNHQSMVDICALFMAVPVPLRFVLKQEMTLSLIHI